MRYILCLLLSILSASCGSYYLLPKQELEQIPLETKKIIVQVPYEQMKLLRHIAKYFSREGYTVQTDDVALQANTGFKSIEGGASVRMIAAIDTIVAGGCIVTITGEWGLNTEGQLAVRAMSGIALSNTQNPVVYEGRIGNTKPGIAFQHMLLAAKSIPAGTISYKK